MADLVHISNPPALTVQTGGLGFDADSKWNRLKPATLVINQRMTQAAGAVPGKFRIIETGQQFEEMTVVLLQTPKEARAFYEGDIKTPATKVCYSYNMKTPHEGARVPQAMNCFGCQNNDWSRYNQTKNVTDIPKCDAYIYIVLIDTAYRIPLQMFVRGANKAEFKAAWDNILRVRAKLVAEGKNPNLFDISFKVRTKLGKKGTNYVLDAFDFDEVPVENRDNFGSIYLDFVKGNGPVVVDEEVQESAPEVAQTAPTDDYIQI